MHCISQTYHRTTKTNDSPVNAIYFPYNGILEHSIVNSMPFNLYASKSTVLYDYKCNNWNEDIIYFDDYNQISDKNIDLFIVHYSESNIEKIINLAQSIYCPIILINSTKQKIEIENGTVVDFYDNLCGFNKISIKNKPIDILLCGDYSIEDQNIVKMIQGEFPNIVSVGYNYNSHQYKTYEELLQYILYSKICISANGIYSNPIISLLAASCGTTIVTNKTPVTSKIFTNNEDAILFENLEDIKKIVNELLADFDKRNSMNYKAQKLLDEKFNQELSKNNWLLIYDKIKDMVIKI